MRLYRIYDTAAGVLGPVFEAANDVVALRQFHMALKDNEWKDEFELYCFALFNTQPEVEDPLEEAMTPQFRQVYIPPTNGGMTAKQLEEIETNG